MTTKIEWTDETWNPVVGCELVSPGCTNCYAAREASGRLKTHPVYAGLAVDGTFTGEVRLLPDRLTTPLRWTKPRRVFVNSMSDLFHKDVPDDFIAEVFAVMAATPRHTYQVLTKRHGRMRSLLRSQAFADKLDAVLWRWMMEGKLTQTVVATSEQLPLPNVWLGVSVEDQERADLRIPALLETPAAVRFLSCEPLLGPVSLSRHLWRNVAPSLAYPPTDTDLGWVIVGGESGPHARPMHPEWARQLRDECVTAGVPYLFKQWGEWSPDLVSDGAPTLVVGHDGSTCPYELTAESMATRIPPNPVTVTRVGKKHAGRHLDGRTWDDYPDTP